MYSIMHGYVNLGCLLLALIAPSVCLPSLDGPGSPTRPPTLKGILGAYPRMDPSVYSISMVLVHPSPPRTEWPSWRFYSMAPSAYSYAPQTLSLCIAPLYPSPPLPPSLPSSHSPAHSPTDPHPPPNGLRGASTPMSPSAYSDSPKPCVYSLSRSEIRYTLNQVLSVEILSSLFRNIFLTF